MITVQPKLKITILGFIFLFLFLLVAYFIYKSISLDYLPIFSDEYGYYLDAKAFQLCDRLDAAFTINEYYSKVGNFSFHGFIYALFYGIFFKFFAFLGIKPSIMLANIVMVLLLSLMIAFSKIDLEKKLFAGIVFFSNLIFLLFIASSMSEIFHIVFAAVAGYLLYLIYSTEEKKYLYIYIFLAFALSLFRLTWIFLLFGLFPLSTNIKDFLKYSLLLLLGLIFTVVTMQYFYASFPFGFMYDFITGLHTGTLADALSMLYEHFIANVVKYFYSEGYLDYRYAFYYKYLYVALLLYSIYSSFKTKEKSIIAATLIALIFILNLFLVYDAYGWREVRVLAAPFILLVFVLILNQKYIPIILVIIVQLATMPAILERKRENDWNRDGMHSRIEKSRVLYQKFLEFEKYILPLQKKEISILLDRRVIPTEYSPITYQLPLSVDGKCIKYSLVIGDQNDFNISRAKSDLLIRDHPEDAENMKLVGNNEYFYFYKWVQ